MFEREKSGGRSVMWSGVVNGHGVEDFVQQLQPPGADALRSSRESPLSTAADSLVPSPSQMTAAKCTAAASRRRRSPQQQKDLRADQEEQLVAGSGRRGVLTYRRGDAADCRNSSRTRNVAGDSSCLCLGCDMGSLSLLLHLQMALFQVKHFDVGIGEDFVHCVAG